MRRSAIGKYTGMSAKQFQDIRKELGYTQAQLANIIGYSRTQVGNLERGQYKVERTLALVMFLLLRVSRKKREETIYQVGELYGIKEEALKQMVHRTLME